MYNKRAITAGNATGDSSQLLMQTSKNCRALQARLQNIVTTDESMHKLLSDGWSNWFEIYDDIDMFMKVRIKDRDLPLNLSFQYSSELKRRDVTIVLSHESKDPTKAMNAHSYYCVSDIFLNKINPF